LFDEDQGLEFIHAHVCVASNLVRHTPRHTVTELYRQTCSPLSRQFPADGQRS
jgi:hypothetical protein